MPLETRPLGRTGLRVSEIGVCLPEGPSREPVLRRARERGVDLFWSEQPVDAPVVLPGAAASGWARVAYNLLDQTEANGEIARLSRDRQGVVATRVLAGGALAGGSDGARVAALKFLAKEGRTLAQAAVQFVLANEAVSCVLVRVSSMAHLDELLDAVDAPPLTGSELEHIFEVWSNRFE